MAITRDELRDRINGTASGVAAMTDLEDATFGRMLNGYNPADASNVSEDDAAQLLADKIVELFEDIIYKDPSKATGTINDVRARLTSSGRLGAAKDAYIKNVMEIAQRRVADITTQLADLKTKYNDQAFVNGLAANVAAVTNKNVREALWKKILEVSNDEVFSQNDDKAKAQADGDAFWTLLNGAMAAAHATETLTTIQNNTDYKNSVDTAWTNVQNGYTGEYRELDKTITKLKSDLGGLVTDALLDADDDRIRGIYSGNTVGELISLAEDVDAFLEIASEDEMKEVRDALNEARGIPTATTANRSITSNPKYSKSFTDAVTEIERVLSAGSVRTTGIDVAAINASINDPATGLQKLYNDAEAAFDAADQAFKEAEFKNNNFDKSLSDLEHAASVATGWEKTLLDAEVNYRRDPANDPLSKLATNNLERSFTSNSFGFLTLSFNIADERAARDWLDDYICNKGLADLVTAIGTDELKDTFKNEITTRFGASAAKIIPLVEREVFSRNACIAGGQWYAAYGNSDLEKMLRYNKRLDASGAPTGANLTIPERGYIEDTIRARKDLRADWFVKDKDLVPDANLDLLERIQNELGRRKKDLTTLKQTRDDAERDRDAAKTNLEAAQKKVASREGYTRFHTCKDTRDSDLAANAARRPKIAELKAAEDIKAVYDVLLADAVRDLATQQNIDDAAIRTYLSAHGRYSELTGSTYPKKTELENQLVSEIKRRLSKVKKVTNNSGPKKRSWFKSAAAFIAGKGVGIALACIPGTPVIGMVAAGTVLGGSLLNAGANLVSRIVHNSATKCPTGRAQKFLNNLNGYTDASGVVHAPKKGFGWGILRGVNKIRKSINKFVEDHPYITRAVQGASSGYLMGEFHEMATGETVWDSVRNWWNGRNNPGGNPPSPSGDPTDSSIISDITLEEGVEYDLSGFKDVYYGPGYDAPAQGLMDATAGSKVILDTRPSTMGIDGWRHLRFVREDGTLGDYGWVKTGKAIEWLKYVATKAAKTK